MNYASNLRTSSRRFAGSIVALAFGAAITSQLTAAETPAPELIKGTGTHPSATPHYRFADSLEAQEAQLKTNPLMLRFAASRARMAADRYRPAYHFVSPESTLNDPNGVCFWQGRWHLFYQATPPDEFPDPKDTKKRRQHWGHAVSEDLVRWRDLPYAIYPGIERLAFSGSTWVDKDRVVAFYPGIDAPGGQRHPYNPAWTRGQMVAVSRDPLLLNWEKSGPLKTDGGDSDIWKEGDTYYGLIGAATPYYPDSAVLAAKPDWIKKRFGLGVWASAKLWTSKDLKHWEPRGELFPENAPFAGRFGELFCPNLQRIGSKHIMLFFSHRNGGQYFLGDYDEKNHRFRPYDHGRFNHGQVAPGGVHAPSAVDDGNGGVINILNINAAKQTDGWDQIMSLPQHLTLGEDHRLRIGPIEAIASLRGEHRHVGQTIIPANDEVLLPGIEGNAMELNVEIDPKRARWVQLNVLRSPGDQERTSITFFHLHAGEGNRADSLDEEVVLDTSRSSILPDVLPRPPEKAAVNRENENLRLRVFIDRSVVEVFVNGRQYLAMRVYPGRKDSLGVSLRAHGGEATLKKLDAWQMKPIWPVAAAND